MKKLMMTLAAVAITAGFAAKADNITTAICPNAANCPDKTNCEAPCPDREKCDGPRVCPFDGLNLSDAQKQQLKDLRAKRVSEMKRH